MGELDPEAKQLTKYTATTDCTCFLLKKKVIAMLLAHKTDDNPFILQQFLSGELDSNVEFAKEKDVVAFLLDETTGQTRSSGKFNPSEPPVTPGRTDEGDAKDDQGD